MMELSIVFSWFAGVQGILRIWPTKICAKFSHEFTNTSGGFNIQPEDLAYDLAILQ